MEIFLCNIFGEMINTLRAIPSEVKLILYVVSAILMLLFLKKAIKVNYSAKSVKGTNLLWFIPIILLLGFVYLLGM